MISSITTAPESSPPYQLSPFECHSNCFASYPLLSNPKHRLMPGPDPIFNSDLRRSPSEPSQIYNNNHLSELNYFFSSDPNLGRTVWHPSHKDMQFLSEFSHPSPQSRQTPAPPYSEYMWQNTPPQFDPNLDNVPQLPFSSHPTPHNAQPLYSHSNGTLTSSAPQNIPSNVSPYNVSPRLSAPGTPANSSLQQYYQPADDASTQQALYENPNRQLYTHREQLQFFRSATGLPMASAIGPFVPQQIYKPHTNSDRKRYVEEVELEAPIYFWANHPVECGISLSDALHSRVKRLENREETVFNGRGPSVSIRLEWAGYRPWSRQIPTKDFRSPPGPITRAKLAKNVAKCVQRFIEERKFQQMEDDADIRWRVGTDSSRISLDDLILVSIHHVSLGSWQPQLRLRRPLPS